MISGLVALLTGESTINSIVGSRVYVNSVLQPATLPYILITQTGSEENQTIDGTSGLRFVDFDIDCKADRSVESADLGKAVRTFIADYSGAAGSQTIKAVLLHDESTQHEPPTDGKGSGTYTTLLDVTIQYTPA